MLKTLTKALIKELTVMATKEGQKRLRELELKLTVKEVKDTKDAKVYDIKTGRRIA